MRRISIFAIFLSLLSMIMTSCHSPIIASSMYFLDSKDTMLTNNAYKTIASFEEYEEIKSLSMNVRQYSKDYFQNNMLILLYLYNDKEAYTYELVSTKMLKTGAMKIVLKKLDKDSFLNTKLYIIEAKVTGVKDTIITII